MLKNINSPGLRGDFFIFGAYKCLILLIFVIFAAGLIFYQINLRMCKNCLHLPIYNTCAQDYPNHLKKNRMASYSRRRPPANCFLFEKITLYQRPTLTLKSVTRLLRPNDRFGLSKHHVTSHRLSCYLRYIYLWRGLVLCSHDDRQGYKRELLRLFQQYQYLSLRPHRG